MKERLIEILMEWFWKDDSGHILNYFTVSEAENITNYLLKNGVIVPPCKVGDTVYCVKKNEIIECIVREFSVTSKGLDTLIVSQKHKYCRCTFIHSKNLENLDEIKFTKEEAEQALKGVKGE